MAPLKPIEKDKTGSGKRAKEVLDIATKVCDLLKKRNQLPQNLSQELEAVIKRSFPLAPSTGTTQRQPEFESLGCTIWNAATNTLLDDANSQDPSSGHSNHAGLILSLRVFAFYLLNTVQPATSKRSKDVDRFRRNFKIALKTCRFCLDNGELDIAHKVLDTASDYVSASQKDSPLVRISGDTREDEEHNSTFRRLEAEFYLLQMTHAWKIGNFDAAQLHFNRVPMTELSASTRLAESAADLCHEAGKSLQKQGANDAASAWLERALSALDACGLEYQGPDAPELRLAITSSLVDSLLRSDDSARMQRAQFLVEELATTHGFRSRMAVQLMYLDIILAQSSVSKDKLTQTMLRVVNSAVLTDRTFKIIMQAVHRTRKTSADAACNALRALLTNRLLSDLPENGNDEQVDLDRIEKACVTYVHFVSSLTEGDHPSIDGLQQALDAVAQRVGRRMSPKATHAAQTLIWKASGASDPEIADRWCGLLKHPLFDSAGQINKTRIGRKAITMAMSRGNWDAAKEAFFNMPASLQNESLTRYLVFKVALHSDDYDLALESLQMISKHVKNDHTHLYACVLDAQQSRMRPVAVAALQAVLSKEPSTTHLPTLLRCTARLLIGELDTEDEGKRHSVMTEVVCAFENAANSISDLKKRSGDTWRAEVQWWSKNAYNLALRWCENMDLELLVRLLTACTVFINAHPNDGGVMHLSDIKRRKALCHFLSTTALVVLARINEEGSETRLQAYLQARQQIDAYDALVSDIASDDNGDFKKKSFEILKLDLECILHLREWNHLGSTLQACLDFQDVDEWETLADIVLIIRQNAQLEPGSDVDERINRLLDRIINETWQHDKDIIKTSRWLRVSFSLDLGDGTGEFARKLLHQAAGMAKKARERSNTDAVAIYPEHELQWLATTAYNKAIDLLTTSTEQEILGWIDGALELARYADDDGALHANLSEKREMVLKRLQDAAEQ